MNRHFKKKRALSALCLSIVFFSPGFNVCLAEEKPVDMDANHLDFDQANRTITAHGQVRINQPDTMDLYADKAIYSIDKREILATGNIRILYNGDQFSGENVQLNMEKYQGSMQKAEARLKGSGNRIQAETVQIHSQETYTLQDATYTHCACGPGEKPAWELAAKTIDIDRTKNTVTAQSAQLRMGDVPVLWVPWWEHPLLPKRQSGFLFPTMHAAGGNGFEADIPYYWNIAPQRDATFTLHPTSRRGTLTKMQYRYMGDHYKGSLDTLNIYDTVEERHRGLTLMSHQQNLGNWDLDTRLAASQTRDFLNDFQQKKLIDSRERRLESHVTADRLWLRQNGYSNFQGGSLWYQNLDAPNDLHTVQRLPFLSFTDDRPLNGIQRAIEGQNSSLGQFKLHSNAKFDSFYQQSNDAAQRLNLAPEIQYWRSLPVGHLSGAVGVQETAYMIQGDPNQTGRDFDSTMSRESASMRMRMDLDLARTYGDGAYKHTLEPAIQYVMLTANDQNGLPNFDATLRNFSVSNLYGGNLYSGDDRISTGQWVAYGVTSRLFGRQDSGNIRNIATFTIGQRWAPEGDREYQESHPLSDLVSGLEWSPGGHWTISMAGRYDPYRTEMESMESGVGYSDANATIHVGYHRNQPKIATVFATEENIAPLEDLSLLAKLRLNDNWLVKQHSDYSLETQGIKSWRTGVTYEQECWSLDLSGGRNLSSQTKEHGGGFIGFFLNLRGLGGYGITS
ncbi:MAG: LPS-assembly protein LptD [Magnetococcales bacterium]|nr:LPS-assembly protein LptD [Magnetococcales bacterium]